MLVVILCGFGAVNVQATAYISTKTSTWADTTAWTPTPPAGGPAAGDTVTIANTHTIALGADASAVSVTINSGGTLACSTFNLTLTSDLIVNGSLTVAGSSGSQTVSIGGNLTFGSAGSMTGAGTSAFTLTFTGSSSVYSYSGASSPIGSGVKVNWNVNSGATLTLNNDVSLLTARGFTNNGTLHCGTQVISGTGSAKFTLASGATFDCGHGSGIDGNVTTPNVSFSSSANYTFSGSGDQVTGASMPVTVTGNITIQNGGNLTVSSASGFYINSGGVIAVNSPAVLALSAAQVIDTSVGSGTLNGTGTIQVTKVNSAANNDDGYPV